MDLIIFDSLACDPMTSSSSFLLTSLSRPPVGVFFLDPCRRMLFLLRSAVLSCLSGDLETSLSHCEHLPVEKLYRSPVPQSKRSWNSKVRFLPCMFSSQSRYRLHLEPWPSLDLVRVSESHSAVSACLKARQNSCEDQQNTLALPKLLQERI